MRHTLDEVLSTFPETNKDWIVESVNWDDSQLKCIIMIGEC